MMTCRQAIASLLDFVEGTLGREKRQAVERHIAHCTWCRRIVCTYATVRLCSRVERQHAPAAAALPRLLGRLRHHCKSRSPSTQQRGSE